MDKDQAIDQKGAMAAIMLTYSHVRACEDALAYLLSKTKGTTIEEERAIMKEAAENYGKILMSAISQGPA